MSIPSIKTDSVTGVLKPSLTSLKDMLLFVAVKVTLKVRANLAEESPENDEAPPVIKRR